VEWLYMKQQPISESAWSHKLYSRTSAHTTDIVKPGRGFTQDPLSASPKSCSCICMPAGPYLTLEAKHMPDG